MDSLSLPELRHPSSPTLEHWCSWFLDSKTCTISPLVLRPSDSDWITPPALLVLQLVVNRQRASSSSVTKSCLMLATPWIIACQAPLSVGFSRQEYWRGLPFPSPVIFPIQGSNLCLPYCLHCQADSLPLSHLGSLSLRLNPNFNTRTSLMVRWITVCLLMQGTQVQLLVQGDPTCAGTTKPMHHNY